MGSLLRMYPMTPVRRGFSVSDSIESSASCGLSPFIRRWRSCGFASFSRWRSYSLALIWDQKWLRGLFYLWEIFWDHRHCFICERFSEIIGIVLPVREIFWDHRHCFTCERFSEIVVLLVRDFLISLALFYLWEIFWDCLLSYLWEIFWYHWHCFTCERFSEIIGIVLPVRDFLRSPALFYLWREIF